MDNFLVEGSWKVVFGFGLVILSLDFLEISFLIMLINNFKSSEKFVFKLLSKKSKM